MKGYRGAEAARRTCREPAILRVCERERIHRRPTHRQNDSEFELANTFAKWREGICNESCEQFSWGSWLC